MEQRGNRSGYQIGFDNCEEVVEPIKLPVAGELPAWLEGTLLRNGPGVYEIETDEGTTHSLDHWFDGLAVLHRFTIEDGTVRYRNAHLARGLGRRIADQGYADHMSFGNDPCQGLFGKLFTLFRKDVTDPKTGRSVQNTGVTVGKLPDDRLISKTDASLLQFVDWETLDASEPVSYADLDERFEGQLAAAHSQKDLARNRLINYALKLGRTGQYTVFSVAEDPAEHEVLASFDAPPAYIHSFALTERYVVLIIWPTHLNALKLLWNRNITDSMSWEPEAGTIFHVVDRRQRKLVARYRSEAFFAFHNVNAWNEGDDVIIDLCGHDDAAVIDELFVDRLRDRTTVPSLGRMRRYRLEDVSRADIDEPRQVSGRILSSAPIELPRFNQRYHMSPTRYVYGISEGEGSDYWNGLVKIDVETGDHMTWSEADCYPGEPIMLAAPDGEKEDDGVVVSVVLDGRNGSSFLVVLDATDLSELCRATGAPAVPFGFHGNFYGVDKQEQ